MDHPRHGDPGGDTAARQDLLVVGYVAGAHGIRGAMRIHLHDPASSSLQVGSTIRLHRKGKPIATYTISRVGEVPGKPQRRRVELDGLHTRDGAEALRGCEIAVARVDLPPLEEDEFYLADAMGLPVQRQLPDGTLQALGTVVGLTSNGVQDLFEVEWVSEHGKRHRWLLPVLPQFIEELDADRLLVEIPLGFVPDELESPEPLA